MHASSCPTFCSLTRGESSCCAKTPVPRPTSTNVRHLLRSKAILDATRRSRAASVTRARISFFRDARSRRATISRDRCTTINKSRRALVSSVSSATRRRRSCRDGHLDSASVCHDDRRITTPRVSTIRIRRGLLFTLPPPPPPPAHLLLLLVRERSRTDGDHGALSRPVQPDNGRR